MIANLFRKLSRRFAPISVDEALLAMHARAQALKAELGENSVGIELVVGTAWTSVGAFTKRPAFHDAKLEVRVSLWRYEKSELLSGTGATLEAAIANLKAGAAK